MTRNPTERVYRLLVEIDDRQIVFDAPPFRTFKQARAQIAGAVRRHAQDGAIHGVILQAGQPVGTAQVFPPRARSVRECALRWSTLDRWGTAVITRILAQTTEASSLAETRRDDSSAETHDDSASSTEEPATIATAAPAVITAPPQPAPAPIPATTADSPASHRPQRREPTAPSRPVAPPGQHRTTTWQLPLTMVFLLATWAAFAALVMGGNLFDLVLADKDGGGRATAMQPFDPTRPSLEEGVPLIPALRDLAEGLAAEGR